MKQEKDILLVFEKKVPLSELTDTERQAYDIGIAHGESRFLSRGQNLFLVFFFAFAVFAITLLCVQAWPEFFLK